MGVWPSPGLGPRLIGLVALAALVAGRLVGAVLIERARSALRTSILDSSLAGTDLATRFAFRYMAQAQESAGELTVLSDAITSLRISPTGRASLLDVRQGGIILAHVDRSRIM